MARVAEFLAREVKNREDRALLEQVALTRPDIPRATARRILREKGII